MTVARSAAEVLKRRVSLEVESIERLYLNLYVPRLQAASGVVGFFWERGFRFASGALMAPITNTFVAAIKSFVEEQGVDPVRFVPVSARTTSPKQIWPPPTVRSRCYSWGWPRRRPRWGTSKRRNPDVERLVL